MAIDFDHPNEDISTSSGGKPTIGGTAVASETYADGLVTNMVDAIISTDTITLHEAALTSVAATSWQTIFDLAGATELLGGVVSGAVVSGIRLTIDGTVVINSSTTNATAHDTDGTIFSVISLPHAKAASSMKLEFYNNSASARSCGWEVYTR